MLESLETRRLYAASAVLKDGVLGVVGTSGSDKISIDASAIIYPGNDAGYGRVDAYVVTVNGKTLGIFAGDKVSKIKVFALGGNDRVNGMQDVTLVKPVKDTGGGLVDPKKLAEAFPPSTIPTNQPRPAGKVAAMYVEGGSGRDRIAGSYGNDTLKGGDGNDDIADHLGRNWIEGNAGDDEIRVYGVRETIQPNGSIMYVGYGSGKNKILAGAGRDTVYSGGTDILLDVPEDTGVYPL